MSTFCPVEDISAFLRVRKKCRTQDLSATFFNTQTAIEKLEEGTLDPLLLNHVSQTGRRCTP